MEFTSQQLNDLLAVLARAADDIVFQQEFVADPTTVLSRDASVPLETDVRVRVLFSSDADVSIVLPIPADDQAKSQPLVVFPGNNANETSVLSKMADLAKHVPTIVRQCLDDADFRSQLIADPNAAIQKCCGVNTKHKFQVVDPLAAEYTVIMPGRAADSVAQSVICLPPVEGKDVGAPELPGVSVYTYGQPDADGELSDDALEAVVGGKSNIMSAIDDAEEKLSQVQSPIKKIDF